MKSIFILSVIFAVAFSHALRLEEQILSDLWEQWKMTHQKVYTMSEDETRFNTFAQNYLEILEFNALNTEATLGLNAFADLSRDEFKNKYLGLNVAQNQNVAEANYHVLETRDVPDSVDWREKGGVNTVKNQGSCGSCWAFSAVAALEGLSFVSLGKLGDFSEQNLVDCVGGNCQGCDGGLMSDAFAYTAKSGIVYEHDYPYTARTGKCTASKRKALNINTGYKDVPVGDAGQLKAAVAQQVVSVAVDAGSTIWQFYKGGVVSKLCGANLNHGVAAVGYGCSKGSEAFIVRNSWGNLWGDSGYIHISTNESANSGQGVCGILSMSSYPTTN